MTIPQTLEVEPLPFGGVSVGGFFVGGVFVDIQPV